MSIVCSNCGNSKSTHSPRYMVMWVVTKNKVQWLECADGKKFRGRVR